MVSAFLATIATGISINIATNLAWDSKVQRDNKKVIEQIQIRISDFNRRYDNTELDTFAFQKFLESSGVIDKIYSRVFNTFKDEAEPISFFNKTIAKFTFDEVNKHYEQYSKRIKNENVFYEYFCDLVASLINIRESLLTIETSAQTAIITEKIDISKQELKEEIAKMREDNIFAEDKIKEIEAMISLFKFKEAEQDLSEVFESFQLLSSSQRELIFYQKARILIHIDKYSDLYDIQTKIGRINRESKYIAEVNFHIACKNKDIKLLENSIKCFENHKYSLEKILLKRVNFEIASGNFKRVLEMITFDGELINDLLEYHEAHFYYGCVLNNIGNFDKAYQEFSKAFELHKNIIYKYNSLISKFNILQNGSRVSDSQDLLNDVRNTIKEFKEIQYILEYLSDEEVTHYWSLLISLVLIINPKQALEEIMEIDERLGEYVLIKSMKADVYIKNNMYSKAKAILEETWASMLANTFNLFFILSEESEWNGIISKYESIEDKVSKEHPSIIALYLKAKSKFKGYDIVRDDIVKLSERYSESIFFVGETIQIVLENQDEQSLIKVLEIITVRKKLMCDEELKIIGEILNKYSKFEETRNLVEERINESEQLLKVYIQTFGILDDLSDLARIANEKVKDLYNNGCRFKVLLRFKAQVEIVLGVPRKVVQTLEEYKSIYGMDEFYAYYYVLSKIQIKEYEGLNTEIEFLLDTDDVLFHQLVAALKAEQGNWDEAQRIALSALYLSHEKLGKEKLMNFISMHMLNIDKISVEMHFANVISNSIVTLRSSEIVRNIAIHNNRSIISESGEYKFGCENYHSNDVISLILISNGRKGEIVTLDDGEYEIVNIVNLYAYFHNYCLSKLQEDYPEHEYFISHSASTGEELIEEMKKTLKLVNESRDENLRMYNFGIDTGLPISFLSGKNIDDYSDMIISLLNHESQHLFVGEVSVYKNRQYVLSLSSIIILAVFRLLDKLERIADKLVVTTDVEKSIKEGMKESQKHAQMSTGVVLLNKDGNLSGYSYTEEDKKNRKTFWTNIMLTITKIKKDEVEIDDNDMYEIFGKYLLDEDVSSIELSKKSNKVLVSDDLFIRKLHHGVTGTLDTTNIIGLIVSEELATFEELITLTLELVKSKYLYPLNTSLIYEFSTWILSIQDDESRILYFNKLKEVYKHILADDSDQHYRKMHEEFVKGTQNTEIPVGWIYELVREPFKLKPLNEFIQEKKTKIFREMFGDLN